MVSLSPFVPAEIVRPAELTSVVGPALMMTGPAYGEPILISEPSDHAFCCYLGKQCPFEIINENDFHHLSGGVIDGVKIELCFEGSAIDEGNTSSPGMLVQNGTQLLLCLSTFRSMRAGLYPITKCQPPLEVAPHLRIGFQNWQIVRWVRDERFILWSTLD
jgi:hypothetical protein